MDSATEYKKEAQLITNYLLGVSVEESELATYAIAMQKLHISFSNYEQELWSRMMKGKSKMALIDAGLALKEPNNNARRKVFTMLAILEASPHYANYFLPKDRSVFYVFKLFVVGLRAIYRAVVGYIYVNLIKRKCS